MPEKWHALSTAILAKRLDLVELLLVHGADCNLDKGILTTVRKDMDFAIPCLKLLCAHGLQLNRVFTMFDEPGTEFTALDRVEDKKGAVYTYLRQQGAKHYKELTSPRK